MKKLLDKILISDNVVEDFYLEFNGNTQFKNWLNKVLPEVEQCEMQQQENPWHKYNVLGHILHSVEEMNKQTHGMNPKERKMLAYTMFFHDIGKPECHIRRVKNGAVIDSFFNHNIASEKIALRALPQLEFEEKEVQTIAKLVNKHDIFMFIKTYKTDNKYWRVLDEKLVKDEIDDLNQVGDGEKLMKYLVMVGRSDNLSQNEKMTEESLNTLKKFDQIIEKFDKKRDLSL